MKKVFPSSKIYIAKSNIKSAGRGVFANQNIKKNEIIETSPVIIIPKNDVSNLRESILVTYFFYFGKKKEHLAIALGFGSIYDHAYSPNAIYKINNKEQIIVFTALTDIKKGDEITFNYNYGNPKNKTPLWFDVDS